MNDCLPQWTNLSIQEEQQHTTASGCFDELHVFSYAEARHDDQGGTLVIFFIYYGISTLPVPTLRYLNATIFFSFISSLASERETS